MLSSRICYQVLLAWTLRKLFWCCLPLKNSPTNVWGYHRIVAFAVSAILAIVLRDPYRVRCSQSANEQWKTEVLLGHKTSGTLMAVACPERRS